MNKYKIGLIKSAFLNEGETRKKLAEFILSAQRFSMDKECFSFEKNFAEKQQRKYATFVNSGSSANLILIQSLLNLGRLKRGDRVGVSAITWSTNIAPIIQLGLVPVAIDCEVETLNISSETLAPHVENLNALFLTNALGLCGDLDKIADICRQKNIILLEDNCEALGSRAYGKNLGNFGLASTFSFFLGHHISALEGGMVCTDDEELHNMLVVVRAHGWSRQLSEEKRKELREKHFIDEFYELYTFYDVGYNVRPTEINGFLGNNQLPFWDEIALKRNSNFMKFIEAVSRNSDLIDIRVGHMDIASSFAMPVICKSNEKFEEYRSKFEKEKVEIRPIIAGDITRQPFYKKYITTQSECPNASFINNQGFYFGNNSELTTDEIDFLISLV